MQKSSRQIPGLFCRHAHSQVIVAGRIVRSVERPYGLVQMDWLLAILVGADLEGDGAHRAGDDAAGLQDVLRHVGHGRLAVGARDARQHEMARRPPVEFGRQVRQPDPGRRHAEHRHARRKLDLALQGDRGCAFRHSV